MGVRDASSAVLCITLICLHVKNLTILQTTGHVEGLGFLGELIDCLL